MEQCSPSPIPPSDQETPKVLIRGALNVRLIVFRKKRHRTVRKFLRNGFHSSLIANPRGTGVKSIVKLPNQLRFVATHFTDTDWSTSVKTAKCPDREEYRCEKRSRFRDSLG